MAQITLDWPQAPLSEVQWRARMENLAERAERLIGRSDITLQARARLACEWLGLAWSGFSPATIAASARGSLMLGENLVFAAAPADQIAERLDLIWQEARAQDDPVDGVVEAPALLLELPHRPANRPNTRRRKKPEPDDIALGDLLEGDAALEPADLSDLADDEFEALDLVDRLELVPEPAPDPVADPDPLPVALGDPLAPVAAAVEPEPAEPDAIEPLLDRIAAQREARSNRAPRRRPRVDDRRPEGWLTPDEAAAQIGRSGSWIRKRMATIPPERLLRAGFRSQWIDPAAVELLA